MKTLIIEQTERENVSLRMGGQVLSEMNHAYLTNRIGLPDIEQFQLKTALAILNAAGCSSEDTELITTVLLLIYHGLSVHEKIDEGETDDKFRHLKVLAGDYYSSKYYYLLASGGQIELIGLFAEAIARINEAKVERGALLRRGESNLDKYLLLSECIQGELLYALSAKFLPNDSFSVDLVKMLVRVHVLGIEYDQFMSGQYYDNLAHLYLKSQASDDEIRLLASKFQDSRMMTIHVKYGTSSYLFDQLQAGLITVKSLLAVQDAATVSESFDAICAYLFQAYTKTQRLAEER